MNLIIEVIGGVAYALDFDKERYMPCNMCEELGCKKNYCSDAVLCTTNPNAYYRRLTPQERVELQKAIGRGLG